MPEVQFEILHHSGIGLGQRRFDERAVCRRHIQPFQQAVRADRPLVPVFPGDVGAFADVSPIGLGFHVVAQPNKRFGLGGVGQSGIHRKFEQADEDRPGFVHADHQFQRRGSAAIGQPGFDQEIVRHLGGGLGAAHVGRPLIQQDLGCRCAKLGGAQVHGSQHHFRPEASPIRLGIQLTESGQLGQARHLIHRFRRFKPGGNARTRFRASGAIGADGLGQGGKPGVVFRACSADRRGGGGLFRGGGCRIFSGGRGSRFRRSCAAAGRIRGRNDRAPEAGAGQQTQRDNDYPNALDWNGLLERLHHGALACSFFCGHVNSCPSALHARHGTVDRFWFDLDRGRPRVV